MILFHGTNCEFDDIDLKRSKPGKDFGYGFYLSTDKDQAWEMAKTKVDQMECGTPVVMAYEVDDDEMNNLNIKRFSNYSEEWVDFVNKNRNNSTDTQLHNYDIVIGPIADDRVGTQLWRYNNEYIDKKTLIQKLQYHKGLTIQYFFGTEDALKLLKKIWVSKNK